MNCRTARGACFGPWLDPSSRLWPGSPRSRRDAYSPTVRCRRSSRRSGAATADSLRAKAARRNIRRPESLCRRRPCGGPRCGFRPGPTRRSAPVRRSSRLQRSRAESRVPSRRTGSRPAEPSSSRRRSRQSRRQSSTSWCPGSRSSRRSSLRGPWRSGSASPTKRKGRSRRGCRAPPSRKTRAANRVRRHWRARWDS